MRLQQRSQPNCCPCCCQLTASPAVLPQCVAPPPAVDCKSDPAKGCATCQAAPNTLWCATCATAGWIVNAAGSVSGWCLLRLLLLP